MFTLYRFLYYLAREKDEGLAGPLQVLTEMSVLLFFPLLLFLMNVDANLTCCNSDSATPFSPDHMSTIFVWYVLSVVAYLHVTYFLKTGPPLLEVIVNWILLFGILLNLFIVFQTEALGVVFSLPIILLFLIALMERHRRLTGRSLRSDSGGTTTVIDNMLVAPRPLVTDEPTGNSEFTNWLADVLVRAHGVKHPLIFVLGLPFFVIADTILLLFGQQPDSVILAFTQTYGLPLSTLDPVCRGVSCGEHYLCSIAANGHPGVVRPLRMGVRHGRPIICNRQLLVANAFEELLQERFPAAHRIIRRNYDRVGDFIHKDYTPYENPWLCDLIYLVMKPADWCFRIVLYLCDRRPEERIARQYR